ncbi:MAG: hypothetical protein GW817_05285 [Flavobacteriales bacterium]|nr:hypothetical protein [Flavobacteriales bacterium]
MELVVTRQHITREIEPKVVEKYIKPEGLLNSNYQCIAKSNLENVEATSIFGIKQRIKSYQYSTTSSIETLLKVGVFMILYLVLFSQ